MFMGQCPDLDSEELDIDSLLEEIDSLLTKKFDPGVEIMSLLTGNVTVD
jgi:hypothetical protein